MQRAFILRVLDDATLTPNQQRLALLRHIGRPDVGRRTLGFVCNLSDRTTRRVLSELRALGLVDDRREPLHRSGVNPAEAVRDDA
jgi:DNA-binding transcriptional ArsR family regulator